MSCARGRAAREVADARFVGEVKCSQAMYDALGERCEMWKVGDSLIKARMKETGARLAGLRAGGWSVRRPRRRWS